MKESDIKKIKVGDTVYYVDRRYFDIISECEVTCINEPFLALDTVFSSETDAKLWVGKQQEKLK